MANDLTPSGSVTTVESLLIEVSFVDGDTRTITIRNPADDLTLNAFSEFSTWLATNQVIIGDRAGADFSKIKQARRRTTTTVVFYL